jgi:hypothetical protein
MTNDEAERLKPGDLIRTFFSDYKLPFRKIEMLWVVLRHCQAEPCGYGRSIDLELIYTERLNNAYATGEWASIEIGSTFSLNMEKYD